MLAGDSHTIIRKTCANLAVAILQSYADARSAGRILDGIVEEYQKQLVQEGFVSEVRDLLVQLTHDGGIFGPCPGVDQGASLFEHLIYIQRLTHEVQLPGIRHREGE